MTRFWIIMLLFFFVFFGGGCTLPLQTAETVAKYPVMDGEGNIHMAEYRSGKEMQGIDAQYYVEYDSTGEIILKKGFSLKVDKSGTPEAAYMALAEQQRALAEHQRALLGMLNTILGTARRAAPIPGRGLGGDM